MLGRRNQVSLDQINLNMKQKTFNFDDLLECPICTEMFTDPIIIVHLGKETSCLHRFCRECVEKLIKTKSGQRKMRHCPGKCSLYSYFKFFIKALVCRTPFGEGNIVGDFLVKQIIETKEKNELLHKKNIIDEEKLIGELECSYNILSGVNETLRDELKSLQLILSEKDQLYLSKTLELDNAAKQLKEREREISNVKHQNNILESSLKISNMTLNELKNNSKERNKKLGNKESELEILRNENNLICQKVLECQFNMTSVKNLLDIHTQLSNKKDINYDMRNLITKINVPIILETSSMKSILIPKYSKVTKAIIAISETFIRIHDRFVHDIYHKIEEDESNFKLHPELLSDLKIRLQKIHDYSRFSGFEYCLDISILIEKSLQSCKDSVHERIFDVSEPLALKMITALDDICSLILFLVNNNVEIRLNLKHILKQYEKIKSKNKSCQTYLIENNKNEEITHTVFSRKKFDSNDMFLCAFVALLFSFVFFYILMNHT